MVARRWALLGGPLAAVQMSLFVVAADLTRPGYDASRNWISQLSLGPGGRLAAVNLAVCGLWLALAAVGLRHLPHPRTAGNVVLACGLCLVGVAVVPTDPGLGYPPGVPAAHTAIGALHQLIGMATGVLGIAAVVLLGRFLPRPWGRPAAAATAALMTIAFGAAVVLVVLDDAGVLPGTPSGLLERIALFAGLAWIAVVCLHQLAQATSREERAPRAAAPPRVPLKRAGGPEPE